MKKERIQSILFILIIVLLCAPAIQYSIHIFNIQFLSGASTKTGYEKIKLKTWFDAEYQQNTDQWVNENFGFRPLFVRLNNQLEYSLLKKINARNVYEGKDKYLFRFYQPNQKYTTKFRGKKWLDEKVKKFQFVYDTLKSLNKHFVLVIAPGKHYYHANLRPDSNKGYEDQPNNYKLICKAMDEHGIPYIDFNKWFLKQKDTISYPVYSKGGIHWTQLASFHAMDSLVQFMKATSKEDFPEIGLGEAKTREKPWSPDIDIYKALNIFTKWDELDIKYAKLLPDTTFSRKPDVLIVADSYFHAPSWSKIPKKYFSENYAFWYYNRQAYDCNSHLFANTEDLFLEDELNKREYFVILSTIMNLENFGWGFIDQLYSYYKGTYKQKKKLSEEELNIRRIINTIKSRPPWLNSVKKKAGKRGISLDSMLRIDAKYMINKEKK